MSKALREHPSSAINMYSLPKRFVVYSFTLSARGFAVYRRVAPQIADYACMKTKRVFSCKQKLLCILQFIFGGIKK